MYSGMLLNMKTHFVDKINSLGIRQDSPKHSLNILLAGNFFQRIGFAIIVTYTGLYLYQLGASLLEVSLFSTIPQIIIILASLPWGKYSDNTGDRRRPIILGSFALSLLFIAYLFLRIPIQFVLAASIAYLIYAPYVPLANAYSTCLVQEQGKAVGGIMMSSGLGWFTGSTMAGILFELLNSFQSVWLFGFSVCILASVMFLFLSSTPESANVQKEEVTISIENQVPEPKIASQPSSYRSITSNSLVLLLFIAMTVQSLSVTCFTPFYGPYFIDVLNGPEVLYGLSQGLPTLFGTILVIIIGYRIDTHMETIGLIIMTTFIAQLVAFTGLFLTNSAFFALLFWSIPFYPGLFVGGPVLVSLTTQLHDRGKGMTLFNGGGTLGRVIGPLLATSIVLGTTFLNGFELPLASLMPIIIIASLVFSGMGFVCSVLIYFKNRTRERLS